MTWIVLEKISEWFAGYFAWLNYGLQYLDIDLGLKFPNPECIIDFTISFIPVADIYRNEKAVIFSKRRLPLLF